MKFRNSIKEKAFKGWLSETTVYHGSKSPIEVWDGSRHLSGYYPGFYAWPDKEKAKHHGNYVYEVNVDDSKFYVLEDADDLKMQAREAGFPTTQGSGYPDAAYLKSLGYEGIKRGAEYIIFNPANWSDSPTVSENRQLGRPLTEVEPSRYGHRNAKVTIYRGVLTEVTTFNSKDYITLSYKFALGHAKHTAEIEEEPAHVLSARVLASEVFEAYNPGEYFYDGPEIAGKPMIQVKPTVYEMAAPDLSYLLGKPGEVPQIGPESVKRSTTEGISVYQSPHGSYRYVYMKDSKPIAALQLVSMDGDNASIANVWTDENHRRQGIATELLNTAKKDFDTVKHHDDVTDHELSDDAQQWKSSFDE